MGKEIIHIEWEGPSYFEEIQKLKNVSDYGDYQIYGDHLVYGQNVLLYIGKTETKTFGERIV